MKVPDVQLSVRKPNKMTYLNSISTRRDTRSLSVVYYWVQYVTLECSVFGMCISETGAMHLNNKLICYDNLEYVEVLDNMIGRNNFI